MNIFISMLVNFLNGALKASVAWVTWSICGYFNLPEWAMLTLVIMAVQSTFITYKGITV